MKRILIVRLRKLGDIVFTLPGVQVLRKKFPRSQIDYLLEKPYQGFFELFPQMKINELVVERKLTLSSYLRFLKTLRSRSYDAVIDFHSGPRAALFSFATGAPLRIGYQTPNRSWAYNKRFPRRKANLLLHSVYNQAQLLQGFGIEAEELFFPEISRELDFSDLRLKELAEHKPYLVIHVGAGNKFRDWGEKNFAALCMKISHLKMRALLIGESFWEQERALRLADNNYIFNCSGRLAFNDFLALTKGAMAYLGVDSGPLHLASLTSVPLIALYGPNIPAISGPFRRQNVFIFEKEMNCRPCSQRSCRFDRLNCLEDIEVNDVFERILSFCNT